MKNSFLFVLLPHSIFLFVSGFVRMSLVGACVRVRNSAALIVRVSLSLTVSVYRVGACCVRNSYALIVRGLSLTVSLTLSRRCVFAIMSMVYTNRSVSPLNLYLFICSNFRYSDIQHLIKSTRTRS